MPGDSMQSSFSEPCSYTDNDFSDSSMEEKSDLSEHSVCRLGDFDFCRLLEVSDKTRHDCFLCKKERNKKVRTTFFCCSCNVPCCLPCYDSHRRKKLQLAIRVFGKSNLPAQIKISRCGEFLEAYAPSANETSPKKLEKKENDDRVTVPHKNVQKNCFPLKREVSDGDNRDDVDDDDDDIACHGGLTFSSVKPAVTLLKEKYGVVSEVMFNGEGSFKCMYFQDSHMKDFFNFHPHRICIDLTFKLYLLDIDVLLFLSEDSNGQSEVISVALVSAESMENLTWLLTMFKKHNPGWRNIKILITDSLIQNRDVIRSCFPDAHLMISSYQAIRTFKRALYESSELDEVPSEQKKSLLEHFKSMILSCTEMEYSLLYQQLQSMSTSILEYFDRVWIPLKSEWRIRIECYESIHDSLNSFLSFTESKIKMVLCSSQNLHTFIEKFFYITKLLRAEKRQKISEMLHANSLSLYSKFTAQYHISKVLTPYAAEFVNRQLDISAEININPNILLDSYIFCHSGLSIVANSSTCSCKFFSLTFLPCCHIFAVRRVLGLPVFDESLCNVQWTEKYYLNAHSSLLDNYSAKSESDLHSETSKTGSDLLNNMLTIIASSSSTLYEQRMDLLNEIIVAWQKNSNIYLQFDGSEENENLPSKPTVHLLPSVLKEELHAQGRSTTSSELQSASSKDLESTGDTKKCSKPDFLTYNMELEDSFFAGENINFIYLTCVICRNKETCIQWLQHMQFLSNPTICGSCGTAMTYEAAPQLTDGATWVCRNYRGNKKSCSKRCGVRRGTWFERSNMTLEQILTFAYMWVHNYPQQKIISELGISHVTCTVWEKFFRRVCISSAQNETAEGEETSGNSEEKNTDKEYLVKWRHLKSGQDPFIAFLDDAQVFHQKHAAGSYYSLQ